MPKRGRPLTTIVSPMWWPEPLRQLAYACDEVALKAQTARHRLELSRAYDWHRAAKMPVPPILKASDVKASAETLILQQVLRAYEEELTVLRGKLAKEYHTMVTMLNLDDKDPPAS